jgi:ATP-dependent DNA ligase
VRLYTTNGPDWTERYPLIVAEAARLKVPVVIDAEVVCTDEEGRADFDRLHSRCFDHEAVACVFDLLRLNRDDLRRRRSQSVRRSCGNCCAGQATASTTSSTLNAMEPRCTRLPASSGWRASCRSG